MCIPPNIAAALAASAHESLVPGVGSEQARMLAEQTGDFGAYGLGKTMQAASTAEGLSPLQRIGGQYGGNAMVNLSGEGNPQNYLMMAQGLNMMGPQQRPQPEKPKEGRPFQQGPKEPLPLPNQGQGYKARRFGEKLAGGLLGGKANELMSLPPEEIERLKRLGLLG